VATRVVLIGKPSCHLCDDAKAIIAKVCLELDVEWAELSIEDDPALASAYFELIPVTLVDGKPHDQWRVNEARLRTALLSTPES
jgi:glutaredoxin